MNTAALKKFDLALAQYETIDRPKCERVCGIVQGYLAWAESEKDALPSSAQPFMFYDSDTRDAVRGTVGYSGKALHTVAFVQNYIIYQ